MKRLSKDDLIKEYQPQVVVQRYSSRNRIDGVKIEPIKIFTGEDGSFEELVRVDDSGHLLSFPDFKVRQVNWSQLLPSAIKAWHLHYNQEDIWYVPYSNQMILGLWDLRHNSPTKDLKMRVPMGGGNAKLVYIPRGVAHGVVNISHLPGTILYYTNQYFDSESPDENRLPWDAAGANFWQPERG